MEARYKYGHKPGRRRRTKVMIVLGISFLILGGAATLLYFDIRNNQGAPVETTGRTVVQALDDSTSNVTVDDEYFKMELPVNWKEMKQQPSKYPLYWQATGSREDNRYVKIYVDNIPKEYAVNRMVPVSASGSGLSIKEVSNNCSTFTKGGIAQAGQAQFLENESARYEGVDFICNLARIVDNEVGTSSPDGINTVVVAGPTKGKHSYFFVYVDHNIQPDYNIFYNALRSFEAK